MRQPASFAVSSLAEATRALEYFNGFHDGFMRRIVIDSQDKMHEDFSQDATGIFDVTIDFAHYNYAFKETSTPNEPPFAPYNQIIRAEFRNVQDLFCDFSSAFLGNSIIGLRIHPANRRQGGSTATESCLALHLARHYYLEAHRRFELRESQFFTFSEATFSEQSPENVK